VKAGVWDEGAVGRVGPESGVRGLLGEGLGGVCNIWRGFGGNWKRD
jgi:hypothetical protein